MTNDLKKDLGVFRKQLDKIDSAIILLIAERFKITREVGKFKKENKLPPLDKSREDLIYEKLESKAIDFNIEPNVLKGIWKVIMTQSKEEHKNTINS